MIVKEWKNKVIDFWRESMIFKFLSFELKFFGDELQIFQNRGCDYGWLKLDLRNL